MNTIHLKYGGKGRLWFLNTVWQVFKILRKEQIQVVHTHIFDANLIGQLAAFFAGISKRIYTRHYSTAAHLYGKGRIKWDKLINWLATDIIAISEVVNKTLIEMEGVSKGKVRLIHHGFDLEEFRCVDNARKNAMLQKYSIKNCSPIIGVVSTFHKLKGIEYIIFAFKEFQKEFPGSVLVLANAKGKDEKYYYELLDRELPERNFRTIRYENDISALFSIFNIFIHAPIDPNVEAFGQVYIEAMASNVPMVITRSGIAGELVPKCPQLFVADYQNSSDILNGLLKLTHDTDYRADLISSYQEVLKDFQIEHMMDKLSELYLDINK